MRRTAERGMHSQRRGAVIILVALLLPVLLGMVAFGVDTGYISLVRSQLQVALDSAALASAAALAKMTPAQASLVAIEYANYHKVAGNHVVLATANIEVGKWNLTTRQFSTGNGAIGTAAVRLTAQATAPLFFAPILGRNTTTVQASSIATVAPRDIAFVVDLSGSMNDDTDAAWAPSAINNKFAADGYPTVGSELLQDVFDDFGFGTYPGTQEWMGQNLGYNNNNSSNYYNMTGNSGPLISGSIPAAYRISSSDSESVRKKKCYSYIIDTQLARIMPLAKPTPSSTNSTSYAYWERYIDYLCKQYKGSRSSSNLPIRVANNDILSNFGNTPKNFPGESTSVRDSHWQKLGYNTYVQFMMDWGRNQKVANLLYAPLSLNSNDCPMHSESTPGGTFNFPPREQPTHASRRAIIAAIQVVAERNVDVPDDQRDRVSIITFDMLSPAPVVAQALTTDYNAAMIAATKMQAVDDDGASTATETGLIKARDHLKPTTQGGQGRLGANKVVVLLTDGVPNLKTSSASTIATYIQNQSDKSNFYSSDDNRNAPIMQASIMQGDDWQMFPVGLGLGCDYTFLDRASRQAATAKDGQSPRGSGNPAEYESRMAAIFEDIITSPRVRLVR